MEERFIFDALSALLLLATAIIGTYVTLVLPFKTSVQADYLVTLCQAHGYRDIYRKKLALMDPDVMAATSPSILATALVVEVCSFQADLSISSLRMSWYYNLPCLVMQAH